jgi:hypothetical protein
MTLSKELIEELIKTRKITNNACGFDKVPGRLMLLDSDEIDYENEVINIKIYAWYDKKTQNRANSFVISYRFNYIILDWHNEAVSVYEYLINKYEVK